MPHPRYFALIERLQDELSRFPRRYRLKLIGLGLAGFVALLMPLLLATLCLGLTLIRLREHGPEALLGSWPIFTLVIGLISLRAMWLQVPPPPGPTLKHNAAPKA